VVTFPDPRKLAFAALLGGAMGCHGPPAVDRKRAPDDPLHPVGAGVVAAQGIVEPYGGEVRLASVEAGVVAEIFVEEGATVEAGELLARLEDSSQRAAVDVARAEVRQAAAELEGTAATPEEVRVAEADLATATARIEQQRRESERADRLGKAGAIAPAELERIVATLDVDEANVAAARARLSLTKRGARPAERTTARARLEAAEARLASARAALARREVRAAQAGMVLWSRYHVGEFCSPEGPLFVLGDVDRLQVRIEVDDYDAPDLDVGTSCELRADDGVILGDGQLARLSPELGRRALRTERPTDRTDARVREAFVEIEPSEGLAPGRRVWSYCTRRATRALR
jgi:multidrug resistance efflux pump